MLSQIVFSNFWPLDAKIQFFCPEIRILRKISPLGSSSEVWILDSSPPKMKKRIKKSIFLGQLPVWIQTSSILDPKIGFYARFHPQGVLEVVSCLPAGGGARSASKFGIFRPQIRIPREKLYMYIATWECLESQIWPKSSRNSNPEQTLAFSYQIHGVYTKKL